MNLSEKAQTALDGVVAKFKSGDISPIVDVAVIRLPEDAPARRWSYGNRVLAYAQTGSMDCRGYRQWQQVNRQVEKGGSAAFIIRPKTFRKDKDTDNERMILAGFGTVAVFPYHVTEGNGGESLEYKPRELPPLADVAANLNIPIRYEPTAGMGALGWTDTEGKVIALGTDDTKTFFHELAHAIHARINGGKLEGGQVEEQETVAEFTATVLMALYGISDRTGNCWQYISQYAKEPIVAITKALRTVEQVLEVIESTAAA